MITVARARIDAPSIMAGPVVSTSATRIHTGVKEALADGETPDQRHGLDDRHNRRMQQFTGPAIFAVMYPARIAASVLYSSFAARITGRFRTAKPPPCR